MKIRKAKKKEINELAKLILALQKLHSRLDKHYRIKADAVCLKYINKELRKHFRKPKGKTILIAEENNKIIGYVEFGIEKRPFNILEKGAWMYEIYVDKKYRRKGIGIELFKEAAKRLKKKGIEKVDVGYDLRNKESINFWKFLKVKAISVQSIIDVKNILKK